MAVTKLRGSRKSPYLLVPGESFKTTLSMGAPRLAGGRFKRMKEIMQGLVDWREGEDSCGLYGKVVQMFHNGGAG
jgi:hypothetical protein